MSLVLAVACGRCICPVGREGISVFNDDTLGTVVAQRADTDSVHLLKMKEDLEVARLNEANLRMEIEQMRMKYDAADSEAGKAAIAY